MTETVISKSEVPIRLTDERWVHISEEHAELAGYRLDVLETIREPDALLPEALANSLRFEGSKMANSWS
jgi:hypothetical protein